MGKHITIKMCVDEGSFDRIAEAGDTVDDEVAMDFLNSMPPINLGRDDYGISFFQNNSMPL